MDLESCHRHCLLQPEPIRAITQLVKAQQAYHSAASDALQGLIGEVQDAAVTAEAEFRYAWTQPHTIFFFSLACDLVKTLQVAFLLTHHLFFFFF